MYTYNIYIYTDSVKQTPAPALVRPARWAARDEHGRRGYIYDLLVYFVSLQRIRG